MNNKTINKIAISKQYIYIHWKRNEDCDKRCFYQFEGQ